MAPWRRSVEEIREVDATACNHDDLCARWHVNDENGSEPSSRPENARVERFFEERQKRTTPVEIPTSPRTWMAIGAVVLVAVAVMAYIWMEMQAAQRRTIGSHPVPQKVIDNVTY